MIRISTIGKGHRSSFSAVCSFSSGKVEGKSKGITPRASNYAMWYNDVIYAADLIDSSPTRGCMVIKPWGMSIWDSIHANLDNRIKVDMEASNCYLPLLIPQNLLTKEAEHVDGFAKECAVVTHHRLTTNTSSTQVDTAFSLIPDPKSKLAEPFVIRPTSEVLVGHMFSKWIQSYRDLPLKINQWCNVLRWEMRTRPFLRTSEFLWQEGHTAHSNETDAKDTALQALNMYRDMCKDLLALPMIMGTKSPSERFAGALDTYTIECIMGNGWALQSGTSHCLGSNFSKAFDVTYQDVSGALESPWMTSWGVSTRLIGALVMVHGDDKGIVLPPKVSPVQIVIVPIQSFSKDNSEANTANSAIQERVNAIANACKALNMRVKVDSRADIRPGQKYYEWERKGVPLRVSIGPKDIQHNRAEVVVRQSGDKKIVSFDTAVHMSSLLEQQLVEIQDNMYETAVSRQVSRILKVSSYGEMREKLLAQQGEQTSVGGASGEEDGTADESSFSNDHSGFYLAPWCCDADNEKFIKEDCKATLRCYPFSSDEPPSLVGVKCFYSNRPATHWALFARSY